MTGVQFCPVDTWFFRDGSPFTMDAAPQENVGSLFPPHPPTVVGALRAALARGNGWSGTGSWPPKLRAVLGDGPDLGKLRIDGPFLLRNGQPLFRMPRHVLGATEGGNWRPKALLRPGGPVECDLGEVRLPKLGASVQDAKTLKPGDNEWLTVAGLNSALRGDVPSQNHIVSSRRLWAEERRIGLERDPESRTAVEGMLYSTRHVRPKTDVSLGLRVAVLPDEGSDGTPESWTRPFGEATASEGTPPEMTPLGGESRLAELRSWDGTVNIGAPAQAIRRSRKVAVVALSPVDIEIEPGTEVPSLGVRVVSACMDRPQRIGGWDSLARRPLPIRSLLPPGSVLFCKTFEPEMLEKIASTEGGLARIGERTQWGFGLVALGVWPGREEKT